MPKRFFNILRDCAMGKPPGKPRRLFILPVTGVFAFPRRGGFLLKCFSNLIFSGLMQPGPAPAFCADRKQAKSCQGEGVPIRLPLWKPYPQRPRRGLRPPHLDSPPGANEIAGAIWMAHIYVPTAPAAAVGNAVQRPSCTKPAEALLRAVLFGIGARFCPLCTRPLFFFAPLRRRVSFSPVGRKRNGGPDSFSCCRPFPSGAGHFSVKTMLPISTEIGSMVFAVI